MPLLRDFPLLGVVDTRLFLKAQCTSDLSPDAYLSQSRCVHELMKMGRYNTLQSPIDYSTSEYSAYLVVDQLECKARISFLQHEGNP